MNILVDIAHIFGFIFILLGIFIFFLPRKMMETAEDTDRLFNTDGLVYSYRWLFGPLLIGASVYLFMVVA